MAFIFEGKTTRTAHEKIAMTNIKNAINNIVGNYYNCIMDGYEEYLPKSYKDLADEIYESSITNLYRPGYEGLNKAPQEMRFAGKAFCEAYIEYRLKDDEDVKEIGEVANW